MLGIAKRLHRRLSETVLAGVRPVLIVCHQPGLQVSLQLLERAIQLLSERDAVELILYSPVEALADAIGLRRPCFGLGMVNVLDGQVELILVMLALAAELGTAVRENPQQRLWFANIRSARNRLTLNGWRRTIGLMPAFLLVLFRFSDCSYAAIRPLPSRTQLSECKSPRFSERRSARF